MNICSVHRFGFKLNYLEKKLLGAITCCETSDSQQAIVKRCQMGSIDPIAMPGEERSRWLFGNAEKSDLLHLTLKQEADRC